MWSEVYILIAAFCLTNTSGSITFPQGVNTNSQFDAQQTIANVEETVETSLKGIKQSIANLGLRTFRYLLSTDTNIVISPVNIYASLELLLLGAVGETKEEIQSVLGTINKDRKLNEILSTISEVSTAFAAFFDHSFVPKTEFVNKALADFQASILSFNSSNGEEAKNIINGWVRDHTNGSIVSLLEKPLTILTRIVLVNTLTFKGKWLFPFSPDLTQEETFKTYKNTSVKIEFMHTSMKIPLVINEHFKAISLPYQNENGLSMHIILPEAHGISAMKKLLSHLNTNSLKKFRREANEHEVIVIMPKLKLQTKFSLIKALENQGIHSAFDVAKANFSEFADGDSELFVSQMYHGVNLEVDEEGTVAQASTAAVLNVRSARLFIANRPFIFFITDNSDLVLFMGAVIEP